MSGLVKWVERLEAHTGTTLTYKAFEWNDDLNLSFNQIATLIETGEVKYGEPKSAT